MTVLSRALALPRLRTKDSACTLSWFEGQETYSEVLTTGGYLNYGSLGDQAALRLNTGATSLRRPMASLIGRSSPLFTAATLPDGIATSETSLGEATDITAEVWAFQTASRTGYTHLLGKVYATGASPWSTPYSSFILQVYNRVYQVHRATSASTYDTISSGITLPAQEWVHLGMSWKGGDALKLYVNGAQVAEATTGYSLLWGAHGRWQVGGRGGWGSGGSSLNYGENHYGGLLGVRVHNVARSDQWFLDTYRVGVGMGPQWAPDSISGLLEWYDSTDVADGTAGSIDTWPSRVGGTSITSFRPGYKDGPLWDGQRTMRAPSGGSATIYNWSGATALMVPNAQRTLVVVGKLSSTTSVAFAASYHDISGALSEWTVRGATTIGAASSNFDGSSTVNYSLADAAPTTGNRFLVAACSTSSSNMALSFNGAAWPEGAGWTVASNAKQFGSLFGSSQEGLRGWSGDIRAVLVYNRQLTAAELTAIKDYYRVP